MGDSPAVSLCIDEMQGCYKEEEAPWVNEEGFYLKGKSDRKIRVYNCVDSRYVLNDFFAKLRLYTELNN